MLFSCDKHSPDALDSGKWSLAQSTGSSPLLPSNPGAVLLFSQYQTGQREISLANAGCGTGWMPVGKIATCTLRFQPSLFSILFLVAALILFFQMIREREK